MDQYAHAVSFAKYMGGETRLLPKLLEVESLSPPVLRVLGGNPGVVSLTSLFLFVECTVMCPLHDLPRELTDDLM